MNPELKEWLGLTPQDAMAYAVLLSLIAMYLSPNGTMDAVLSALTLWASVMACLWGMRPDPRLSRLSNWIKRVSYPLCLVAALACIYLNFQVWNHR